MAKQKKPKRGQHTRRHYDVYEVDPQGKKSAEPVASITITKEDLGSSNWTLGKPPAYTERVRRVVRRKCGRQLSPARYFHTGYRSPPEARPYIRLTLNSALQPDRYVHEISMKPEDIESLLGKIAEFRAARASEGRYLQRWTVEAGGDDPYFKDAGTGTDPGLREKMEDPTYAAPGAGLPEAYLVERLQYFAASLYSRGRTVDEVRERIRKSEVGPFPHSFNP